MNPKAPKIVAFTCIYDRGNRAMTDIYEPTNAALDAWCNNLETLIQQLTAAADLEEINESMFVILLQGLDLFGPDLMKECFPVLDVIKNRIDSSDLDAALRQAIIFRKQLEGVAALVRGGAASPGQGVQASPTIPPDSKDAS
jgi:hypothetical protein